MKKVFIVHGFMGSPDGNWFPWLVSELSLQGIAAQALKMPTPYLPKVSEWVKTIADAIGEDFENSYLVGHSLGVPAILRFLESLSDEKLGGAVLVSGPCEPLSNIYSKLINPFLDGGFDFGKIQSRLKNSVVVNGDNDPKVPFAHAEKISKNLGSKLISIPGGLHLNTKDGGEKYKEFPIVLEELLKMIKK